MYWLTPEKIFMDHTEIRAEISKLESQLQELQNRYERANRLDSIFKEKKLIRSAINNVINQIIKLKSKLPEDN